MCDHCGYPDHFGEKVPDQPTPTVPTDEELHIKAVQLARYSLIREPELKIFNALRQVRDRTKEAVLAKWAPESEWGGKNEEGEIENG